MKDNSIQTASGEISFKGRTVKVSSTCINGQVVVANGGLINKVAIKDEDWLPGDLIGDPEKFIKRLKECDLDSDVFTFAQKLPEVKPRFKYNVEWDNVAAIPIISYKHWWDHQVSHDLRKDIKRAQKQDVVIRGVEFNDELVRGIMGIYNETPIRQGKRFWHYGKEFETVQKANATFLDRSEFVGAYYHEELIGFIKIVYVDRNACLMQILSRESHFDRRPSNALIAHAVEICERRQKAYLTYGRYTYGKKTRSSLADFKGRNGFREIRLPRYYIPLSSKGAVAMAMKLHLGIQGLLPRCVVNVLLSGRSALRGGALANWRASA